MTPDDRLRANLESLERSAPTDLPPRPPVRGRRPGFPVALPAAVTLAAGLLLAILGSQWLAVIRPPGSNDPTASGDASATPIPSTPAAVIELRWSVDAFLSESGANPGAITEVGGRLLVTGSDVDGPAAWYSDDRGTTWQRASILGTDDEQRPMALGMVAGEPARLLSLGWLNVGANDADRRPVLWASTDLGTTWERVRDEAVPLGILDLAAGGPGLVAVGDETPIEAGGAEVWLSSDGQSWERVPDQDAFQRSRVNAIAERDGVMVAVGSRLVDGNDVPAAWRSSDGRQWSRVDLSPLVGAIEDVAAGPEGFVGVGSSTDGELHATAWHSADGETWAMQTLDETAGGVATGVAVNRLGFVAIGTSSISVDAPGFVWFAPVGGTASEQDIGAQVLDLIASGDRFIGIGGCGPLADCQNPFLIRARPVFVQPDPSPGLAGDLVGTLEGDAELETGCAWLTDASGERWEVLWPRGYQIKFPAGRDPVLTGPGGAVVARAGDLVAVDGAPPTALGSRCQVGDLFEATRVVGVQPQGVVVDWGPLAVIPGPQGGDAALTGGTLRITDACVFLDKPGGDQVLLFWPAEGTAWEAATRTIRFTNRDGTTVTLRDGDAVRFGGGGDRTEESGVPGAEWVEGTHWVARPDPACPTDARWGVSEVVTDP